MIPLLLGSWMKPFGETERLVLQGLLVSIRSLIKSNRDTVVHDCAGCQEVRSMAQHERTATCQNNICHQQGPMLEVAHDQASDWAIAILCGWSCMAVSIRISLVGSIVNRI